MCEVRSKLFANYFCVILYLYINLFPLFYISPCEYFLLYFSSFSFFSYTLFVLDIFLTARNYAIVFYFLCIIIFLRQFT